MRNVEFCVVYFGNIVHADLLKCLLEGQGINAFLEDEFIGMIAPYVSPGGAVKVLIAKSDIDQARKIVEDFLKVDERKNNGNLRLVK
jgi:hypothetical protein